MKIVANDAANDLRLFVPFVRKDQLKDGTVIVEGCATAEEIDKQGEVVSYEASVKAFTDWSETFERVTGGASLGNIRAMHGPVAAGKAIAWNADDEGKKIFLRSKIVDKDEAAKVLEGVYTGYSIGASGVNVVRQKQKFNGKDDVPMITAYRLSEVSIVDNPACPSATLQVAKRAEPEDLRKGMWSISRLADLCCDLKYLKESLESDALWEGDAMDAEMAAQLQPQIEAMCELLVKLTTHEAEELAGKGDEGDDMKLDEATTATLTKSVMDGLTPILQKAVDDKLADITKSTNDVITKALSPVTEELAKVQGSVKAVEKTATDIKTEVGSIETRLKKVEETPAAVGRPAQPVDKTIGGAPATPETPAPLTMEKAVEALEKTGALSQSQMLANRQALVRHSLTTPR